MFREEKVIVIDLNPDLATFIKHGFNNRVRWPLLTTGVVLSNNTTAVNEEWLTSIEHMPTRKIFYNYTSKILRKEVGFCVYLKKSQTEKKRIITLGDFDYYIIDLENYKFIKIDKPIELNETLLHTFQDYRIKNLQVIEIIAFSSNIQITEKIIEGLTFINIETFNKEYDNIKPTLKTSFESIIPFIVTAPLGRLTFYVEHYPWIDFKSHMKEILDFLEGSLVSDVHSHKLETSVLDNSTSSSYNPVSGMLFVNDLLTMTVVNFFGCNSRLNSYHRFDMTKLDINTFLKALSDAFKKIANYLEV
ncbi:RNA polymerase subunit [Lumpy skin disease virus]|uniref:DNA-directed RNA polymerase 35 kDa subunit n=1 Tax=Lumpy skin disease virus TaxID=59509 RepID=A0A1C9HIC9_LSDV|nr:RNA polymerase subunit [Lumpy skin disease virus]AOO78679.1 RNA polymerase subunit [Lumpy skin disease virus]AOO78838.1 RNA polymerase subunit [Lumpy skin disease virus]AOO78996.1 RNA polymerase subunit [Lumpy skin disease virus]AVR51556.1 RNA polymerase subunit [Lumpy skin disease virus]